MFDSATFYKEKNRRTAKKSDAEPKPTREYTGGCIDGSLIPIREIRDSVPKKMEVVGGGCIDCGFGHAMDNESEKLLKNEKRGVRK